MSTNSAIEWTDATWNPVSGCTRVSAGCDHCYAVRQTHRLEAMGQQKYAGLTVLNPAGDRHFNGQVRTSDASLQIPLSWKKPRRVFVNSMSDLFHRDVPFDFVDRVFAVMALTPQHTYQVLTKRPERMAEYLNTGASPLDRDRWDVVSEHAANIGKIIWDPRGSDPRNYYDIAGGIAGRDFSNRRAAPAWPLPNVWVGASVENQPTADSRIPHLLRCPAAVRFLSIEPLLGPLDLTKALENEVGYAIEGRAGGVPDYGEYVVRPPGLGWVIVGGESGQNARPMHPSWARSIRDQCQAAGVPFFFKQWGEWLPDGEYIRTESYIEWRSTHQDRCLTEAPGFSAIHSWSDDDASFKVGKKAAGRLLDGREWNEMPAEATA